ncbi:BZ3500_MvSof-1268-A1-R1_Chr5-3g08288 [Microbotryum saponariae]|uniref:BZ3500_MvSof-1268-A1-R1_Chr5-3g08288 protein n=1 Tax=Microbotryum saponariae TaxID=289078 RepID=A0A2X0NQ73_9BASI|nr:BZ3500_MvSof-1268-A1-R1_Chr5-3g08288 [Microbotryum saponariae]SDA08396.1 BZ3501_MvSof-1269-A2-R1_Chr5-3g08016 [Microbotryum saponariae]
MYVPCALPSTRLSTTTSALPSVPCSTVKPTPYKTPGRGPHPRFKHSLGGLLEEEGEELIAIASATDEIEVDDQHQLDHGGFWAVLTREELSVWTVTPKVVLAKLRRTPLSLRTHGSNSLVAFHTPTRLVVTTTSGHHLLYSIDSAASVNHRTKSNNDVYTVPGGQKGDAMWPKGPGEGANLQGIVLRAEAERGLAIGDGVGCVCLTPHSLILAIQDPPTLRIVPFPSPSSSATDSNQAHQQPPPAIPPPSSSVNFNAFTDRPGHAREGSGWDALATGFNPAAPSEAETVVLDEWPWLINCDSGEVSVTSLIPLPEAPTSTPLETPNPNHPRPSIARRQSSTSTPKHSHPTIPPPRTPTRFVMLTSDARAYLVRWAPSVTPPQTPGTWSRRPSSTASFGPASSLPTSPNLDAGPKRVGVDQVVFDAPVESHVAQEWEWQGVCFHPRVEAVEDGDEQEMLHKQEKLLDRGKGGTCLALNEKFGLVAVGCQDGTISAYNLSLGAAATTSNSPSSSSELYAPTFSHEHSLRKSLNTTATGLDTGHVACLSYTPDGYALAVGWHLGWSIWSVYGRLGSWSVLGSLKTGYGVEGEKSDAFEDHFMNGVRGMFWTRGGYELVVLCPPPVHPKSKAHDEQLFVIPFAKSAVTAAHTPDNTNHAFLQMDDRVMVYRGADQPDMSVINPESDVWQHIKIPASYIATQHPIRYAVISHDARFIAVAGRRGFTHYNALSGRWKLFESEKEENAFHVVGGMAWWANLLIVGCVDPTTLTRSARTTGIERGYQLAVFAREQALSLDDSASLETIALSSRPLVLSVFDSSLLVYTEDNTFHHFLMRPHPRILNGRGVGSRLRLCGSIGFEGVVKDPWKVRGLSWLVPKSQQQFGDPADDLNVATIIFLISGQLVLLRPRRAAHEEVKYDLQILADRIEFYWTHLSGIGTLENSLWGWDGERIRIWLDALTIEKVLVDAKKDAYERVSESVAIKLDFYPLGESEGSQSWNFDVSAEFFGRTPYMLIAVLMEKGIIVGIDQETSLRKTLDFALFRIITSTQLFLHHVLRFHLTRHPMREAVLFASHYQHLVYFAHALEILLHGVLEDEADKPTNQLTSIESPTSEKNDDDDDDDETRAPTLLSTVIDFLDHFPSSLSIVVNCARKTELTRWSLLFTHAGSPRRLFERCIESSEYKTAASYLLVLHNLEPLEQSGKDTVGLLKVCMHRGEWTLCRELLRFLYSLDRTGGILQAALEEGSALPRGYRASNAKSTSSSSSASNPGRTGSPTLTIQERIDQLSLSDGSTTSSSQARAKTPLGSVRGLGALMGLSEGGGGGGSRQESEREQNWRALGLGHLLGGATG